MRMPILTLYLGVTEQVAAEIFSKVDNKQFMELAVVDHQTRPSF
jgi:hypothetical protein